MSSAGFFQARLALNQGPLVQSIVSLTSSLMTNSLTFVVVVFSNTLIFLMQKNVSSFCNHNFQQKISMYLPYFKKRNFNVMLTNNFVKF